MKYNYFDTSTGKLCSQIYLDSSASDSVSKIIKKKKLELKNEIEALTRSIGKINYETKKVETVLGGLKNHIFQKRRQARIFKDYVNKRDFIFNKCREELQTISTENKRLQGILKEIESSPIKNCKARDQSPKTIMKQRYIRDNLRNTCKTQLLTPAKTDRKIDVIKQKCLVTSGTKNFSNKNSVYMKTQFKENELSSVKKIKATAKKNNATKVTMKPINPSESLKMSTYTNSRPLGQKTNKSYSNKPPLIIKSKSLSKVLVKKNECKESQKRSAPTNLREKVQIEDEDNYSSLESLQKTLLQINKGIKNLQGIKLQMTNSESNSFTKADISLCNEIMPMLYTLQRKVLELTDKPKESNQATNFASKELKSGYKIDNKAQVIQSNSNNIDQIKNVAYNVLEESNKLQKQLLRDVESRTAVGKKEKLCRSPKEVEKNENSTLNIMKILENKIEEAKSESSINLGKQVNESKHKNISELISSYLCKSGVSKLIKNNFNPEYSRKDNQNSEQYRKRASSVPTIEQSQSIGAETKTKTGTKMSRTSTENSDFSLGAEIKADKGTKMSRTSTLNSDFSLGSEIKTNAGTKISRTSILNSDFSLGADFKTNKGTSMSKTSTLNSDFSLSAEIKTKTKSKMSRISTSNSDFSHSAYKVSNISVNKSAEETKNTHLINTKASKHNMSFRIDRETRCPNLEAQRQKTKPRKKEDMHVANTKKQLRQNTNFNSSKKALSAESHSSNIGAKFEDDQNSLLIEQTVHPGDLQQNNNKKRLGHEEEKLKFENMKSQVIQFSTTGKRSLQAPASLSYESVNLNMPLEKDEVKKTEANKKIQLHNSKVTHMKYTGPLIKQSLKIATLIGDRHISQAEMEVKPNKKHSKISINTSTPEYQKRISPAEQNSQCSNSTRYLGFAEKLKLQQKQKQPKTKEGLDSPTNYRPAPSDKQVNQQAKTFKDNKSEAAKQDAYADTTELKYGYKTSKSILNSRSIKTYKNSQTSMKRQKPDILTKDQGVNVKAAKSACGKRNLKSEQSQTDQNSRITEKVRSQYTSTKHQKSLRSISEGRETYVDVEDKGVESNFTRKLISRNTLSLSPKTSREADSMFKLANTPSHINRNLKPKSQDMKKNCASSKKMLKTYDQYWNQGQQKSLIKNTPSTVNYKFSPCSTNSSEHGKKFARYHNFSDDRSRFNRQNNGTMSQTVLYQMRALSNQKHVININKSDLYINEVPRKKLAQKARAELLSGNKPTASPHKKIRRIRSTEIMKRTSQFEMKREKPVKHSTIVDTKNSSNSLKCHPIPRWLWNRRLNFPSKDCKQNYYGTERAMRFKKTSVMTLRLEIQESNSNLTHNFSSTPDDKVENPGSASADNYENLRVCNFSKNLNVKIEGRKNCGVLVKPQYISSNPIRDFGANSIEKTMKSDFGTNNDSLNSRKCNKGKYCENSTKSLKTESHLINSIDNSLRPPEEKNKEITHELMLPLIKKLEEYQFLLDTKETFNQKRYTRMQENKLTPRSKYYQARPLEFAQVENYSSNNPKMQRTFDYRSESPSRRREMNNQQMQLNDNKKKTFPDQFGLTHKLMNQHTHYQKLRRSEFSLLSRENFLGKQQIPDFNRDHFKKKQQNCIFQELLPLSSTILAPRRSKAL